MTALENVAIPMEIAGLADAFDRAEAELEAVGLGPRRHHYPAQMSGGEQQMLSLARALATDPVILLLDELSMGLAPLIVAELYQQVAAIAAEGVSVLVVEQFARTVLGVADQAVLLAHGKVQVAGKASEIGEDVLAGAYLGS